MLDLCTSTCKGNVKVMRHVSNKRASKTKKTGAYSYLPNNPIFLSIKYPAKGAEPPKS